MTELRPPPEPKPKPSHGDQHAFLLLPSGHPLQLAHVSRAPRSWARENQSQGDVCNDRLCLGQMQAAICSPSTQSHLTTASPHHCRCPTHLFPPRHGEGHCLQRMGKVYTPMVCSTHKPVILTCFPTKSPFQANLINIISISQIQGAVCIARAPKTQQDWSVSGHPGLLACPIRQQQLAPFFLVWLSPTPTFLLSFQLNLNSQQFENKPNLVVHLRNTTSGVH